MLKPTPTLPYVIFVNFSYELAITMITYDFLEARWNILSNLRTDFNLT